jgi:hypothetical protein
MAEGYHDFVAAEVLTAANLEDYCQNQAVMRFASSATRVSALTSVKTEGMTAFLEDSNTLTIYTGSAWSTIGPVHGGLISWTPSVVQSGAVTTTNVSSLYSRVGRMVTAWFSLSVTGSGTGANTVTISLPVPPATNPGAVGTATIFDTSATARWKGVAAITSGTIAIWAASNAVAFFGVTDFTAGLAAGDTLEGCVTYIASADA